MNSRCRCFPRSVRAAIPPIDDTETVVAQVGIEETDRCAALDYIAKIGSGRNAARQQTALLKKDAITAAIPIIALTAMAMKEDQDKTRAAGCDAYIAKPLRYQELYEVIDALLIKGKVQAAAEANPFHLPP